MKFATFGIERDKDPFYDGLTVWQVLQNIIFDTPINWIQSYGPIVKSVNTSIIGLSFTETKDLTWCQAKTSSKFAM